MLPDFIDHSVIHLPEGRGNQTGSDQIEKNIFHRRYFLSSSDLKIQSVIIPQHHLTITASIFR
jgi:hypothetical protein